MSRILTPELIDRDTAAQILGLDPETFADLIRRGRVIAPVRLSASIVRWSRRAIRKWVQEGCPAPSVGN